MGLTEQEQGFPSDLSSLQMEKQGVREVPEGFMFTQLSAGSARSPGFLAPSVTRDTLPPVGCSARWAPRGPGPGRNADVGRRLTRPWCEVLAGFLVASLVTGGRKAEETPWSALPRPAPRARPRV